MQTARDYLLTYKQAPKPEIAAEGKKRKPPDNKETGKSSLSETDKLEGKSDDKDPDKQPTIWSKRVQGLISAAGWSTHRSWAENFACGALVVKGILAGRRPTVTFVRTLIRLERENALELWIFGRTTAYRAKEITHQDYMRDLEVYVQGHNQRIENVRALRDAQRRPQDLAALGALGAAVEGSASGKSNPSNKMGVDREPAGGFAHKPLRLVRIPPEPGPVRRDYQEDRPRRSPATRLRAKAVAAGLSGQVEGTKGEGS